MVKKLAVFLISMGLVKLVIALYLKTREERNT